MTNPGIDKPIKDEHENKISEKIAEIFFSKIEEKVILSAKLGSLKTNTSLSIPLNDFFEKIKNNKLNYNNIREILNKKIKNAGITINKIHESPIIDIKAYDHSEELFEEGEYETYYVMYFSTKNSGYRSDYPPYESSFPLKDTTLRSDNLEISISENNPRYKNYINKFDYQVAEKYVLYFKKIIEKDINSLVENNMLRNQFYFLTNYNLKDKLKEHDDLNIMSLDSTTISLILKDLIQEYKDMGVYVAFGEKQYQFGDDKKARNTRYGYLYMNLDICGMRQDTDLKTDSPEL